MAEHSSINSTPNVRHENHPREEPPKAPPKRKAFHSKIRMGDGRTVSVIVVPPLGGSRKRLCIVEEDKMETSDEDRHGMGGVYRRKDCADHSV